MNDEKKKILQMVADGIITVDEADELLKVLKSDNAVEGEFLDEDELKQKKAKRAFNFNNFNLKDDLEKTKEELVSAKEKIRKEIESGKVKELEEKLIKGLEQVDKALAKVDQAIMNYGEKISEKIISKFKSNKENEKEGEE